MKRQGSPSRPWHIPNVRLNVLEPCRNIATKTQRSRKRQPSQFLRKARQKYEVGTRVTLRNLAAEDKDLFWSSLCQWFLCSLLATGVLARLSDRSAKRQQPVFTVGRSSTTSRSKTTLHVVDRTSCEVQSSAEPDWNCEETEQQHRNIQTCQTISKADHTQLLTHHDGDGGSRRTQL